MFIRYIARIDESELSRQAAEFCDLLVGTGIPVRLLATRIADFVTNRDQSANPWVRHQGLLMTPMAGPSVNIVAGTPIEWATFWTQRMFNAFVFLDANSKDDEGEMLRSSCAFNLALSCTPSALAHVRHLFSSEMSCPPLLRVDDPQTLRSAILPFLEGKP